MRRCPTGPSRSRARTRRARRWRDRTTRIFRSRRGCCRRRCGRTSRRSMRSRASPTTSPTKGRRRPAERQAQLDAWQRRLHAAVAVERSDGAAACPRGSDRRRARPFDPNARSAARRCSTICVSAFGQDTMTTRYASWADVFDYCRRSANPVGRLVLRIAGYRDEALDRSSDALCTALQLTNFWQDFGRDWRAGRLYVPRDVSGGLRRARRRIWQRPRLHRRVGARARRSASRMTREHVRRGPRGLRRRARPAALRAAPHLARRHAHARSRRARGARAAAPTGRRSARATCRRCCWRAAALAAARRPDGAQDQLLLLVPRAARRTSAARSSRSGTSAARSTMRSTRSRRRRPGCRPAARRCAFWRARARAMLRRRDAGARRRAGACSRSSRSSICRGRRSRTSSTASRWISTPRATRRSTICSSTAAASRRRSA